MSVKYTLWLDDVRDPSLDGYKNYFEPDEIVFWAQNVDQARSYVKRYGVPDFMFLDHDLGPDTVMSFLRWLAECFPLYKDYKYNIISMNPDGRKNIESFMQALCA